MVVAPDWKGGSSDIPSGGRVAEWEEEAWDEAVDDPVDEDPFTRDELLRLAAAVGLGDCPNGCALGWAESSGMVDAEPIESRPNML